MKSACKCISAYKDSVQSKQNKAKLQDEHATAEGYIEVSMSESVNSTLHSSTKTELLALAVAAVEEVGVKTHWLELFSWWFFMSS